MTAVIAVRAANADDDDDDLDGDRLRACKPTPWPRSFTKLPDHCRRSGKLFLAKPPDNGSRDQGHGHSLDG